MKKDIADLAIGDWVVLSSMLLSRFCGNPWKVTNISNNRIYLTCYATDKFTKEVEMYDAKFVARKSVVLAFTTEDEALIVSQKARELSDQYERAAQNLRREHEARVGSFIASLDQEAHPTEKEAQ